jgi:hypothetical protein
MMKNPLPEIDILDESIKSNSKNRAVYDSS